MIVKLSKIYLLLLCVCIAIAYGSFAALLVQGKFFARYIDNRIALTDFVNIYSGALICADCRTQHLNIYDPALQLSYTLKVTGDVKPDQPFYLQVPPYVFAFLYPCSFVPIEWAWLLWVGAGITASSYAIFQLSRPAVKSLTGRALVFACIFSSYPMWLSCGMGQTSLFLLPAFAFFWACLRSGKYISAGLATTIISLKLQYIPVCAAIGCLLGRFKFLASIVMAGLMLLAISVWSVGWHNIFAYPQALLNGETSSKFSGVSALTMQNLRGWLTLVVGTESKVVHAVSSAALLLAIVGIPFIWGKAGRFDETATSDRKFTLLVSITIPLMLLSSLHSHVYDLVYMTIPCLLLWNQRTFMEPRERACFDALVVGFAPLSWCFAQWRPFWTQIYVQPYLLWALLILAIACRLYLREFVRNESKDYVQ